MKRLLNTVIVLAIVVSLLAVAELIMYLCMTTDSSEYTLHIKGAYTVQVFENSDRVVVVTTQENIKED